ncbi:hypothetical protein D3C85_1618680 [compost metagenome]
MVSGAAEPSLNSLPSMESQTKLKSSSGMRASMVPTMPPATIKDDAAPTSASARPRIIGSTPYLPRRNSTARCFSALGMPKRYVTPSCSIVRI